MTDTDADTEYYEDTDTDEDGLLGDEDTGVVDPHLDTIYNLEVVSCKRKVLPPRDDNPDNEPQITVQVQLMIADGEFEGERTFHTFWMGPKGQARLPQHKRNRKSFSKFFEACTGERIGKGSVINPRDCEGAMISAKYVSAEYTNKDGELKNAGQAKWDDFSWSTPIERSDGEWDGEDTF